VCEDTLRIQDRAILDCSIDEEGFVIFTIAGHDSEIGMLLPEIDRMKVQAIIREAKTRFREEGVLIST